MRASGPSVNVPRSGAWASGCGISAANAGAAAPSRRCASSAAIDADEDRHDGEADARPTRLTPGPRRR